MKKEYQALREEMRRIADLNHSAAVLTWDQETHMPEGGGTFRAQQLSTLSGIAHERFVMEENQIRLDRLEEAEGLEEREEQELKKVREDFDKARKYSTEFVQELSKAQSEAFQAWQKAKKADDFGAFAPHLERMIELKQREAQTLGYEDHPYDALLDEFEPGLRTADLESIFSGLQEKLAPLLKAIKECIPPDDELMYRHYPEGEQWKFSLEVLESMGYDLSQGRQDLSTHPFTISFSPEDVRITTRMDPRNLHEGIWSSIHEGGHALYEQGLPVEGYGMPGGEACSMAIHESQARLWENIVGRGRPFWEHFFPRLKEYFPGNFRDVSLEQFYSAMNAVRPGLIRTDADELSYHFHIIIRFEIEKALMEGTIQVEDIPRIWSEKYRDHLGVEVPSDAKGCLQDVHWAHGAIGYFPSYSLGSLYSAQFYAKAEHEVPDLEERIRTGDLLGLRDWLREKVHRWGRLERSQELCERVTGEELDPRYFMDYAWEKYSDIFPIDPPSDRKDLDKVKRTGEG